MTETITDSFCERCGTRYAFEASAKPRRARLGRVRVLTRSVTTFISNDGMPMAEALAAARNDEERADLARQLDAFHKTFNFCMGCRQYTCPSCWNATTGECLTCSPDLTREVLPAAFPDLPISGPGGPNGEAADAAEAAAATAWPSVDLERGGTMTAVEPVAVEPVAVEPVAVEPVGVIAADSAEDLTAAELAEIEGALAVEHPLAGASGPPAAPVGEEPDRLAAGRDRTRGLLRRFRPAAAVVVGTGAAEPAVPAGPGPVAEPVVAGVVAEPVTAEPPVPAGPEPVAEPVTAEPPVPAEPEPAEPEPAGPEPAGATRTDSVEQPTWRMVAPDAPGPPASETVPADSTSAPPADWPDSPAWPSSPTRVPPRAPSPEAAPWAARLSLSRPETAGIWAASSREVLGGPSGQAAPAPTAVQACVSCGLSLSATARFCRRCGSRQG